MEDKHFDLTVATYKNKKFLFSNNNNNKKKQRNTARMTNQCYSSIFFLLYFLYGNEEKVNPVTFFYLIIHFKPIFTCR